LCGGVCFTGVRSGAVWSATAGGRAMLRMYDGDDRLFVVACLLAGTPATRRQWSKWLQGRGKAFAARAQAALALRLGG
jgi:hypothetical protein